MSAQADQDLFTEITRIARGYGWDVILTDRSNPRLRILFEHDKTPDAPPTALVVRTSEQRARRTGPPKDHPQTVGTTSAGRPSHHTMKPDLGPAYNPNYVGTPPHMSADDLPIWRRWRALHAHQYQAFYFDVGLGEGPPQSTALDPTHAAMWLRLTQKRADVVADDGTTWTIIELRAHAQSNAVGRLQQYEDLWHRDPPDTRPVRLLLVSDNPDPDLTPLTSQHAIAVEQV